MRGICFAALHFNAGLHLGVWRERKRVADQILGTAVISTGQICDSGMSVFSGYENMSETVAPNRSLPRTKFSGCVKIP
jgi:hypothetical protein